MPHGFALCCSLIILLANISEPFIPMAAKKMNELCNHNTTLFPDTFEIINEIKIKDEISVVFTPFTDEQLEILRSY